MRYKVGQGIYTRIRFKDGTMPEYKRTYLIVEVESNYIKVLNVSSIEGKEAKAQMFANKTLKHYNPPFAKPSFVKLDSLTKVENPPDDYIILHGGETLNEVDLTEIISELNKYRR